MIAEDIIKEMGAPEDYSNRICSCFLNYKAMCCSREIVSQRAIYLALVQNKDGNLGALEEVSISFKSSEVSIDSSSKSSKSIRNHKNSVAI